MSGDILGCGRSRERRIVTFVYPPLFNYRVRFHDLVKQRLSDHNVDYQVLYSDAAADLLSRDDRGTLPWATKTRARRFNWPVKNVVYQCAARRALVADLVVMQQENKLLFNYAMHLIRLFGTTRIAYFGHGRNFQSEKQGGVSERFKRYFATKVDWWFAYNELSASLVESFGFSRKRITSVNNSIDMKSIADEVASVTPLQLDNRRRALGLKGRHVGIYIGSLYREKRIAFLIEAAKLVHEQEREFELIIVGGGSDAGIVSEATKECDFIRFVGPLHGQDKTEVAMLASVFLIPGAVGLAVLDAFAYGLPLVTTAGALHGPEIDYLESGTNGIIVTDTRNPHAYAKAVVDLLHDETARNQLALAARSSSSKYSMEHMADRFVSGVLSALSLKE